MREISYSGIISKAAKLTLKFKWLWVYGLVIAAISGTGFGNGFGGGGGSSKSLHVSPTPYPLHPTEPPGYLGDKVTAVLGETTARMSEWFSHIPASTWILLVIAITFVTLFGVVVRLITLSWAEAALIGAWKEGLTGKDPTLSSTSIYGLKYWKNVLGFRILLALLAMVGGLAVFLTLGILGGIIVLVGAKTLGLILLVIFIIPLTLLFIAAIIFLTLIQMFAQRLIVLHNQSPITALKKAVRLAKGSFFQGILMGFIKGFLETSIGCIGGIVLLIAVGIPAVIVAALEFSHGMHFPGAPAIIFWIVLFIVYIQLALALRAGLTVFSFGVWNQFAEVFTKGEKNL